MKKIFIVTILSSLIGLTSCNKWLDVQPKTSINQDKLFSSEYGFKDVLTGFYIKMGSTNLYGRELTYNYLDMLAQRYDYAPEVLNWESIYAYDGLYKGTTNAIYSEMYNIIVNINNFLHYVDARRDVLITKNYYEIMKGEALGLRAMLHFDLLRLYGPVYSVDPEGKSIPYRTLYNNIATPVLPAREVVDYVLADLLAAHDLLEKTDPKNFVYTEDARQDGFLVMRQLRMNIYAVKAMLARVYCYKGDAQSKALAYKYAKEVTEYSKFKLYGNNDQNRILFEEHILGIHIYELKKIVDADFVDRNTSSIMSIKPATHAEIYETARGGASDFRANNYAFTDRKGENGSSEVRKVLAKYVQTGYSGKYSGYEIVPLIRLPEMYYIMAECEPDPEGSVAIINKIRSIRGIPASDALTADSKYDMPDTRQGYDKEQTVRTNNLMKEYQKEFYGEGQLFYFYKRFNYRTFYHCPLSDVRGKYKLPIPVNEGIFGKN